MPKLCNILSPSLKLSAYNSVIQMLDEVTIILEPADEGGFVATIPAIPGAVSEGETIEEAREMVLDAARELTAYRLEKALKEKRSGSVIEKVRLAG